MPFKTKLAEKTGIDMEKLPSSYQIIGDVLLIKLLLLSAAEKKIAAKAMKEMFPKGNLFERQRIAKQVKPNEIIIDMFAGIGYFSLGLKKAKKVYAIEKNPLAYKYLKENILLNKAKNIVPINA